MGNELLIDSAMRLSSFLPSNLLASFRDLMAFSLRLGPFQILVGYNIELFENVAFSMVHTPKETQLFTDLALWHHSKTS